MISREFRTTSSSTVGFTIVELLIVIVVIAILAAITVVSYTGITTRAVEASMQTDLNSARNSIGMLKAGHKDYPGDVSGANDGQGLKVSPGNQLTYGGAGGSYTVVVTNPATKKSFCLKTGEIDDCLGTWTTISTGEGTTCGIASGRAYCWGANWSGQLGIGSTVASSTPAAVSTAGVLAGKTVTDIAIGDSHACAVASGAVYCWGDGGRGQLGNGDVADSLTPVAVTMTGALAGKTVTKVAVNGNQTCVIASGKPYCFGDTYRGALGNGVTTRTNQTTPVAVDATGVLAGKTVTDITIGGYYAYNACVVASGKAYCWGANDWGQLGTGTTTDAAAPVAVDTSGVLSGKTVTNVSMYEYHTCAAASGAAYCWGGNGNGYLGNGVANGTAVYPPVAVTATGLLAGKTATAVAPGDYFTCGVASGKAYCWGDSSQGALGNGMSGPINNQTVPVAVDTAGALAGKTVTAIDSGYNHACVIADNLPFCWGDTTNWWPSALGTGGSVGSSVPLLVAIP